MTSGTPVITSVPVAVSPGALAGKERDVLVLTAEERRWGRRRVRTERGRDLALALPTATVLVPGEVLHVAEDFYVAVEAAREPVLVVSPGGSQEAIRVAFEVGNRHASLALDGDRLFVLDDPAMERLLARLGVPWSRERAPFVPLAGGHRHDS